MTDEKNIKAHAEMTDEKIKNTSAEITDRKPVKAPKNRKRILRAAVAVFAAVIVFAAGFFGGSAGSWKNAYSGRSDTANTSYKSGSGYYTTDVPYDDEGRYTESPSANEPGVISIADSGSDLEQGQKTGTAGTKTQNTKLIYTASASLQTTEFEKTCALIRALAGQSLAYIESETIDNGNGSVTYYRSASYVIRVPAENYNSFLSGINENCHVVSLNQKMKDVSEEYFDIEQKLQTLRNKHDRLEALLAKAEKMEDIISLEDALSQTEYEINQYQSSLNKYDSLVSYSTVKISLKEVAKPDAPIGDKPGFFQRLGQNFTDGLSNAGSALEDLAYWVSYNIIKLVILAVIIVVIVKIHPVRKIKAARAKKNGQGAANS